MPLFIRVIIIFFLEIWIILLCLKIKNIIISLKILALMTHTPSKKIKITSKQKNFFLGQLKSSFYYYSE